MVQWLKMGSVSILHSSYYQVQLRKPLVLEWGPANRKIAWSHRRDKLTTLLPTCKDCCCLCSSKVITFPPEFKFRKNQALRGKFYMCHEWSFSFWPKTYMIVPFLHSWRYEWWKFTMSGCSFSKVHIHWMLWCDCMHRISKFWLMHKKIHNWCCTSWFLCQGVMFYNAEISVRAIFSFQ
jgi:hypothetical protein